MKKYDVKFYELFDSEKQAVVSFLSLERRYLALLEEYKKATWFYTDRLLYQFECDHKFCQLGADIKERMRRDIIMHSDDKKTAKGQGRIPTWPAEEI